MAWWLATPASREAHLSDTRARRVSHGGPFLADHTACGPLTNTSRFRLSARRRRVYRDWYMRYSPYLHANLESASPRMAAALPPTWLGITLDAPHLRPVTPVCYGGTKVSSAVMLNHVDNVPCTTTEVGMHRAVTCVGFHGTCPPLSGQVARFAQEWRHVVPAGFTSRLPCSGTRSKAEGLAWTRHHCYVVTPH